MYDVDRDGWVSVAPMSTERTGAAAATWNDKVVVAGGCDSKYAILNSAEQYDPEANRWTPFSSLITRRYGHALVNADNTLYAIGGSDGSGLSSVERYNAESGVWQPAPKLSIARNCLAAATLRVSLTSFFY